MIAPYKGVLLIEPDPKTEDKTDSGILLAKERKQRDGSEVLLWRAKILAVGPECNLKYKPGCYVYYNSFNAYAYPIPGKVDEYHTFVEAKGVYGYETP